MAPDRWRELLSRWSSELIASAEHRAALPPDVIASGWLGYPGATPEEIARAEARLGIALPPSYRAFLAVTNGWRATTRFIDRVRPVGEIGWYRDEATETIAAWREGEESQRAMYPAEDRLPLAADTLQETLAISDEGDGIYLLNPQAIGPDGEWEAWFFADWVPGADAHPSFWDLMQAEHERFLRLLQARR